jgi:hypothetical protein
MNIGERVKLTAAEAADGETAVGRLWAVRAAKPP